MPLALTTTLGPPDTSDCFPSGWEPVTTAYFSPGVCPIAYSIACWRDNSIGTLTETTATCCPSGYICAIDGMPLCSSLFTSNGDIIVTTTNEHGSDTTRTSVLAETDFINAFGIIIRYQRSDVITGMVLPTPSVNSVMSTGLPTASIPSASSQSTTISTALVATSNNTGRKIGIGVGVSLGSIGILSGIFAIWFLRRRPSGQSRNIEGPSQEAATVYSNSINRENTEQPVSIHEMQASKLHPAHEMPVKEPVNISELDGS
ncbi:hypothetical protein V8E54_008470 [Elaphomyces granulatus]